MTGFSFTLLLTFLVFLVWMQKLLRRPLVNGEAALTPMNCIAGGGAFYDVRRGGLPLLHVPLTVLALFVFDCANGLPGQEGAVLTGLLSAGLDCFRLNAGADVRR